MDPKRVNVGTGLVGAPACGDVMKLQIEVTSWEIVFWRYTNYLKVDDDGKIVDAKFKTFGCGSAIASSSLATEWVKGKSLDEAATIKNSDIAKVSHTGDSPFETQFSAKYLFLQSCQLKVSCSGAVSSARQTALLYAGGGCHQGCTKSLQSHARKGRCVKLKHLSVRHYKAT